MLSPTMPEMVVAGCIDEDDSVVRGELCSEFASSGTDPVGLSLLVPLSSESVMVGEVIDELEGR